MKNSDRRAHVYAIVITLFLTTLAVPARSQIDDVEKVDEVEEAVENAVSEVVSLKTDVANLKVALLAQRFATLQAKANWLDREQILMATERRALEADRESVAEEIAELLGCEEGYDLASRACKTEEVQE